MSFGLGIIVVGLASFAFLGLATATSAGATIGSSTSTSPTTPTAPLKGSQKQQVAQVARQYGLSPKTLWGVYGTESSFGANPGTSSAGAQGPFQFIPSTWAQYGHGNVQNFSSALLAAAKYLHSLGANSNPNSPQTAAALNNYNGNGGGASLTSYVSSVLHFGGMF